MRKTYIYCEPCKKVVEKWDCEHQYTSSSGRSAAPLAVYFEGPNGEIQTPGQYTDRLPKRLEKLGYTLKTIQDSHQYSQVMKRLDKEAQRKYEENRERLQAQYDRQAKEHRAELMDQLTTQFGRDFAREAINESERRRYEQSNYSAGSHIEGYEYDGRRE
jgi:hypothetical protein